MAAPGGLTNQLHVGFQNPNSKLYLELNARNMFKNDNIEVDVRPAVERDSIVGKRLLEDKTRVMQCSVGGMETSHTLQDLLRGAKKRLLEPDRVPRTITKSALSAFEAKGLAKYKYEDSVENAASMAVGRTLTTRHLRKQFIEQALIKGGYVGRTLTSKPDARVRKAASTHTGFRIGPMTIEYSFSSLLMLLPRNNSERFDVIDPDTGATLQSWKVKWHPYAVLPYSLRMLACLLGVHATGEQLSIKTFVQKFSPAQFRSDVTAEEIMSALMKLPDTQTRSQFLQFVGFTGSRIPELLASAKDIPLYEQLSDADEYSSTPQIAKSCSAKHVGEMLALTSTNTGLYLVDEGSELMHVLRAHFVALLADEMNVAHALYDARDERIAVRLPRVTITSSGT